MVHCNPMVDDTKTQHPDDGVPKGGAESSTQPPTPLISPDEQDKRLGHTGQKSIYQTMRNLTAKQRLVVEFMLAGVDPMDACYRAGFESGSTLKTIQRKMPDLMERCGLADEVLIETHLKPLLVAEETKTFKTTQDVMEFEYDPSDPTKVIGKTERKELIIEERNYADNSTRLGALNLAFRLSGHLNIRTGDSLDDGGPNPRQINVNIIHVGGEA